MRFASKKGYALIIGMKVSVTIIKMEDFILSKSMLRADNSFIMPLKFHLLGWLAHKS